jgi:hypothetical protein
MRTSRDLESALASLAAADAMESPPQRPPDALLAEFDKAFHGRRPRRFGWIPSLAAAACLVLSVLLLAPQPTRPAARQRPFVAIPYVAPLAPYERPQVIRMEVPMTALMAAGFEVHVPDVTAAVPADVLVGQDGRALAIRLLSGSSSD